jgi:subtilisin family serine protease
LDEIRRINDQAGKLVIHGVNLSLGGSFDPNDYGCGHSPLCVQLRRLWRDGVLVCIAAGNEASLEVQTLRGTRRINLDLSIGDPANLDEGIAVGSVHRDFPTVYGISHFSSRGPTADGRMKPDVVAPGERIMSCNSRGYDPLSPNTWYRADNGTSMACPHISGILAAFLSVRREFIGFPDRVKRILMDRAIDLGRDRHAQGAGMPNLVQMLANT